jgi:hypothetical protein
MREVGIYIYEKRIDSKTAPRNEPRKGVRYNETRRYEWVLKVIE